ncbi:Fatty acid desaturase [Rubripirellula lacrimiformis]|uniref:Fatty acid desaturase n=1 Tax=Rubripirellula lacrimiformis TaxID=1930273 RepID=A0A517NJI4_9BACT|nr:fatty acid desaturase [Rubripirellula lacrimiformis]QDT07297.1 Fatty acid desaturase [Rubripirellula lacrimiformis]
MTATDQSPPQVAEHQSPDPPCDHESYQLTEIAIPIIGMHVLALLAFIPDFITWTNVSLLAITLLIFSNGITLGYHRLLTHRSLRVPKWVEYFYVGLALCCLQESPAKWVSTHRRHHNHSDEPDDPHSPTASFLWSHVGWLLWKRKGQHEFRTDNRYCADIVSDPFYALMEKYPDLPAGIYLIHAFAFWLAATAIFWIDISFGAAAWQGLGVMLWCVVLRTVMVWHFSWSVNSLTHCFGYQNYQTSDHSRNNWLVALLSNGEGWHNNHHHDPASASVQHKWWEFDPTYLQIRILKRLGLATHVIAPRQVRHHAGEQRKPACQDGVVR